MPDGTDFDGRHLLALVRDGKSPFHEQWDVNLLVQEIEKNLNVQVDDIPYVSQGSNCYGIHIKLSKGEDIVARLARSDVNMPDFDGFPIDVQVPEVKFEAEIYKLLLPETDILVSRLLYYRIPKLYEGSKLERPSDIAGRRLFVFQRSEGENNVWHNLKLDQQSCLLEKAAHIRASLYKYEVSSEFASTWLRERLFEQKPETFPIPVAPTREFCIALFTSKIEATIKNIGDMIGWEDDHNTVGPVAAAAKGTLLRLVPHIMPKGDDEDVFYRFVIEHGDFGIHNMSIAMDVEKQPIITSVYDWETGCIVPAILSDPMMAVTVDLTTDGEANPAATRLWDMMTADELEKAATWSKLYSEALFSNAPDFKRAIKAGRDARHLWFALRDWRGDDPEKYFGDLGTWAEKRMGELGVVEPASTLNETIAAAKTEA
ncbi:3-hydroxybutyryl-CoA dehydratase [Trichoderma sp. SZMC 28014]